MFLFREALARPPFRHQLQRRHLFEDFQPDNRFSDPTMIHSDGGRFAPAAALDFREHNLLRSRPLRRAGKPWPVPGFHPLVSIQKSYLQEGAPRSGPGSSNKRIDRGFARSILIR